MRFRVVMCKMGYTELRFNIYIYIYMVFWGKFSDDPGLSVM